jgi:hypothetical protein
MRYYLERMFRRFGVKTSFTIDCDITGHTAARSRCVCPVNGTCAIDTLYLSTIYSGDPSFGLTNVIAVPTQVV